MKRTHEKLLTIPHENYNGKCTLTSDTDKRIIKGGNRLNKMEENSSQEFNSSNNDQLSIPELVLNRVRRVTAGTHVIDYGAGLYADMHIDFLGTTHTRIDVYGVVSRPIYGYPMNLEESIAMTPDEEAITLVFFRSISCMCHETLLSIRDSVHRFRNRINAIEVYDYGINKNKLDEYSTADTPLGEAYVKKAEWFSGIFYHYTPSQIANFLSIQNYETIYVDVPAKKNTNSPGFLITSNNLLSELS
jgi:hypothetical protein